MRSLDQVIEICRELCIGLHPHPDVSEAEWEEWLEGWVGIPYREPCPKCNGVMLEKTGKYGDFKGCSNYPRCKFTTPPDDF